MDVLIAVPICYCIAKYCSKSSCPDIKLFSLCMNSNKFSIKHKINMFLSNDKKIKNLDIYEKKINERKLLENQFINDYPDLTLDERKDLADSITEIKNFDEIEKIEKGYADKVDIICYKIDEFYDNELEIAKVKFDYNSSIKREERFREKISNVMLNDNIDELNNLYCKEQLDILNDIRKKNTYKSYEENDDDNYMI
jgi:hypothetical protein